MSDDWPIHRIFDLSDLSPAGSDIDIVADAAQRSAIAKWLDVESVQDFRASIALKRLGANRYAYVARGRCDLVQQSVVSLALIPSEVAYEVSRELHVIAGAKARKIEELAEDAGLADEDGPEEIPSSHFDLAGPLMEELALSVDPYPRGKDEVFEPPEGLNSPPDSPFAVLKSLKPKG